MAQMRCPIHLLAICLLAILVAARPSLAQKEIVNAQAIAPAKTIYFEDKSGVDAVGKKALAELSSWDDLKLYRIGKLPT